MHVTATLPVSPVLDSALTAVLAAVARRDATPEETAACACVTDAYDTGRPADVVAAAHTLEVAIAGWAGLDGPQGAAHARLAHAIHRRR
jgi:type IV pilus biogenesis protein CpaD/CtpE